MSDILHGGRLPSFAVCERQEAPVITSLGGPLARILRDTLRYTHSKTPRTTSRRCASTYARVHEFNGRSGRNDPESVLHIPLSTLASDEKDIQNVQAVVRNFVKKLNRNNLF